MDITHIVPAKQAPESMPSSADRPITKQELAHRIKELRRIIGGTQPAFANKIGIPIPTYKEYEGARSYPGIPALLRFYLAGADLHWLLTGEGSPLRAPPTEFATTIDAHRLARLLVEVDRLMEELGMPSSNATKAELVATLYNRTSPTPPAPHK